eukprot:scaffold12959_cov116-Isochrysis_galbana.AAC.2
MLDKAAPYRGRYRHPSPKLPLLIPHAVVHSRAERTCAAAPPGRGCQKPGGGHTRPSARHNAEP